MFTLSCVGRAKQVPRGGWVVGVSLVYFGFVFKVQRAFRVLWWRRAHQDLALGRKKAK